MTSIDRLLAEHAALFTENGRVNRPTAPESFTQGRAEILAAFQSRPTRASRHIIANILVDVADDGQSATAQSQILLFTGTKNPAGGLALQSEKPPLVGTYQDCLALEQGTWKFTERRGSLDFQQP